MEENYRNKGNSLDYFPDTYCILDLETTGFSPINDDIIEVGIIKVNKNQIVDEYTSLVKPVKKNVTKHITDITGITNEMLEDSPLFSEICNEIFQFIGNSIIVAHNAHFDINFIYDNFKINNKIDFSNDFFDTFYASKKLLPELKHHRLNDVANYFNINFIGHRALNDCKATFDVLTSLNKYMIDNNLNLDYSTPIVSNFDNSIILDKIDKASLKNNLQNKKIAFTGELDNFTRTQVNYLCSKIGAIFQKNVTRQTDILVLGCFQYISNIKNNKTKKLEYAEKLISDGQELDIIDEMTFINSVFEDFEEI
ncbi:exonuclease domain-containing protein [Finegoldia magna]|uniref:exonuclease domain-containing protein n=1 Tax=Finegoldia magna TaxID=1260 RepID=UPI0026F2F1C7|nr:exonuclease domain-containing protein [Finegoldia magna]